MKATLNFNEYLVLETHYINRNPSENESRDISPVFQWDIQHTDENKNDAGVYLTIKIGEEDENFYIEVQVLGVFTLDTDDMSSEDKENMYRVNAIAILFPYVRSLVSDLTGKGRELDRIILPPLNIQAMMSTPED